MPGPLLAVLLATVAVAAFHPGGVGVVGPVPARLPTVQLPALHPQSLRELLLPAFTVLIVGFSDDVVTARSFARRGEEIVAAGALLLRRRRPRTGRPARHRPPGHRRR